MKHFFIFFVLMGSLSVGYLSAQKTNYLKDNRQEVAIFGGVNADIDWGYLNPWDALVGNSSYLPYQSLYCKDKVTSGTWGASYAYRLPFWGDRILIGASFSYLNYHRNYNERLTDNKIGIVSSNHYTLTPSIKYTWLKREWWQMYSGLAIALDMEKSANKIDKENDFIPLYKNSDTSFHGNFTCTFVGISVGKKYFGFGEFNGGGAAENIYFLLGAGYRF